MANEKSVEQLEKELAKTKVELFRLFLKLVLSIAFVGIILHLIDTYMGRLAFWVALLVVIIVNMGGLEKKN